MSWENKQIEPFRFYCQKILPLVYDESLSYYETLCKIQSVLNQVIENENSLNTAFSTLLEYVNTQLETYAKEQLEEMLNDGTLANIINETLFNTKITWYPTVNDMISSNSTVGQIIKTGGYYSVGDRGGALYYISDNPTPISEELSNGKYANIIYDEYINILQIGCKGDGNTDNSPLFDKLVQTDIPFYIPNEENMFIVSKPILLNQNVKIDGIIGYKYKQQSGAYNTSVFKLKDKSNITISGNGVINGNRDITITTYNPNSETIIEHGHAIEINNCFNIRIYDVSCINCQGDGICFEGTSNEIKQMKDILIEGVRCLNNYRQGISITDGNFITIRHCLLLDNGRQAMNIEPYLQVGFCNNIILDDIDMESNNSEVLAIIFNGNSGRNIKIKNCKLVNNSKYGSLACVYVSNLKATLIDVLMEHNYIENKNNGNIIKTVGVYDTIDTFVFNNNIVNAINEESKIQINGINVQLKNNSLSSILEIRSKNGFIMNNIMNIAKYTGYPIVAVFKNLNIVGNVFNIPKHFINCLQERSMENDKILLIDSNSINSKDSTATFISMQDMICSINAIGNNLSYEYTANTYILANGKNVSQNGGVGRNIVYANSPSTPIRKWKKGDIILYLDVGTENYIGKVYNGSTWKQFGALE